MLMMEIKIHRTLVDMGSYTNVIFLNIFQRMGTDAKYIRSCTDKIVGFAGNKVRPIGVIDLAVELGDYPCQKIVISEFKIVDIPSNYNSILGQSLLMAFQAATSIYHNCMKFPTQHGTGIVKRNQRAVREYDLDIRSRELNMVEVEITNVQVSQ